MVNKFLMMILFIVLFVSGCGNPEGAQPNGDNANRNDGFGTLEQSENQTGNRADEVTQSQALTVVLNQAELETITTYNKDGKTLVPLVQVLEMLNFNVREKDNRIQAGFSDVLIEVSEGSNSARVEGDQTTLSTSVVSYNNQPLITTTDLAQILGENTEVNMGRGQLIIDIEENYEDYGFPEDVDLDDLSSMINQDGSQDIPVVSRGKANRIIDDGRRYLGVPYYFGAPSGYTEVFDCSSFTQYVYGMNGIGLPRVSRDQAKLGTYVPVKDLKKGDLLFFHWPGRNVLVGHVGIYAGNGYMLHSVPNTAFTKDGVQITDLRDPNASPFYETYLGAKRVSEANDIDW